MRSTILRPLRAASAWLALVPGWALAQGEPSAPVVGAAALPQDLSPWGMFLNADIVVKAVMIGLAIASVLTWTVWLAKSLELFSAKRRARAALRVLAASGSLAEAAERLAGLRTTISRFVAAAMYESRRSAGTLDRDAVKERVVARLDRAEVAANRIILRGTGILATIGATAPFVGLFGTVWGIMNSFIGISKAHTTNLAIVAPGIAEALLATAFGLFAAIPAVVIYNMFARQISSYRELLGDASTEVLILLNLDLERPDVARPMHRREPSAKSAAG